MSLENKIAEIIIRVDLLQPVATINKALTKAVKEKIKQKFPVADQQLISQQSVIITDGQPSSEVINFTEWNFYNTERTRMMKIIPQALIATSSEHISFESFKSDFIMILRSFLKSFKESQPARLGLRYIYRFEELEGDPFDWKEHFSPSITNSIDFIGQSVNLSRWIQVLEFSFNDFNVRYQYGMPNPDYPAPIRRKLFVLDFDAYYMGLQSVDEIEANLNKFYEKIQEMLKRTMLHSERV